MIESTSSIPIPAHGGQLRQIAAQFDIPQEQLIDFSANIHPNGPPPSMLQALREAVSRPEIVRDYPDIEFTDLRNALAAYVQVEPSNVVIGNGVVPLLEATLRAFSVQSCLLPVPAFSEYRKTLARCAVEIHAFQISSDKDFSIDAEQLMSEASLRDCDAMLLANPQNPSGISWMQKDLRKLVRYASEHNILVLLDEAFIDYLPEESLAFLSPSISSLVVFRSLTKFFAIAGLRVAYAVAHAQASSRIQGNVATWPVSTLACVAACHAVKDVEYSSHARTANQEELAWLRDRLIGIGLYVYPGVANYLLIRLPAGISAVALWRQLITRHCIVVRCCDNFEGLDGQFIRVCVRRREDNLKFLGALRSLL